MRVLLGITTILKDWRQQSSHSGELIRWTDSDIAQWNPVQLLKTDKEKFCV